MWWFHKKAEAAVTMGSGENLPAGGGLPPKAVHQNAPQKGKQMSEEAEPTETIQEYLPPAVAFWGTTMEERLTQRTLATTDRNDRIQPYTPPHKWSARERTTHKPLHWAEAAMNRSPTKMMQGAASSATTLGGSIMGAKDAEARRLRWREVNWDNSVRLYCPMHMRGIKPITAEAWSKDTERYASPWDRIGIGYTDAGDAEAHRRFLEWKRYNGPNDVQRKLLDESMSYQEAIRQKRNKRRFHGAIGLDRFG